MYECKGYYYKTYGKSLNQICREHNVSISLVKNRISKGYSLEEALTIPKETGPFKRKGQVCKHFVNYKGVRYKISDAYKELSKDLDCNVPQKTVYYIATYHNISIQEAFDRIVINYKNKYLKRKDSI